ncbi:MAG: phenylalanine--tRNA ligase subunit beta [Candidatus Omnitrophica bacterium]|nr:phenylalanine--tRNA ligase subunit beta [Candidatus Omnitrophota bacterium]
MRYLLSWVKEFLEVSLHPEALAERLTLGGMEVTRLEEAAGDRIFEIEVTPNRPDLLSHLGLSREIAPVLGRTFHLPRRLRREMVFLRASGEPVSIRLEDTKGCRRYVGIVIEGVEVGPSPQKIVERLTRLGVRPVNNIVDATNLTLLELGQPLHAFDLDRLEGELVRVRRALPKETLVTIDGVSRALSPDVLVIADASRPVALAGIMGGKETEVRASTKRVLLESAWFDPVRVRRGGRIVKLSSESSYRFERGADPAMVPMAAMRSARMILKLAGGKVTRGPTDAGDFRVVPHRISMNPARANEVLGVQISSGQQRRFLERLGCKVSPSARGLRVEPPHWRSDLRIAEDLHEELSRLFGYDRIPSTLPPLARRPLSWVEEPWIAREERIRQFLAACGGQEICTYSLVHPESHGRAGSLAGAVRAPLALKNAISLEYSVLRNTLLVGALETVARNLNRKSAASFHLFELGRVYHPGPSPSNPVVEKRTLSLIVGGTPEPAWGVGRKGPDLLHLKGILERLFEQLGMDPALQPAEGAGSGWSGELLEWRLNGELLGRCGRVDPRVASAFEISEGTELFYAELDLELVAKAEPAIVSVRPLAKVPPVVRDLAVVVAREVPHEELRRAIQEAGAPLLKETHLFDLYQGKQVAAGKKSMTFRLLYSAGDRTLTDEEVSAAHEKIVGVLSSRFQAALR